MKTIKHLLLGGFSLLLLSCGGKKSGDQPVENISEVPEYPITISFAKGIDTEQEVRLSENCQGSKGRAVGNKARMSGCQSISGYDTDGRS